MKKFFLILFVLASCGYGQPRVANSGERVSVSCENYVYICREQAKIACGGRGWSTEVTATHMGNPLAPHREAGFQWLDSPEDHEQPGTKYIRFSVDCN